MSRISDPTAFASALRVNREWYRIGKGLIPRKKQEFLRVRQYRDRDGFDHHVTVYPNKTKHGKEEIYEESILRTVRFWDHGVLQGTEYEYDDLGATIREIPWLQGKKHGRQVHLHPQGTTTYKYWQHGKLTLKETYNHAQLQSRNKYSGDKTFVHYERDRTGAVVRTGVYVNKQKHGIYHEHGQNALYIHGVNQPWYTTNRWEMLLYIALALFFGIVLVCCYRERSLTPALTFSYFVILAFVLFVIPLAWGIWRGGRILFTRS